MSNGSTSRSQPVNTGLPPVFARTQAVDRLKGSFTAQDIEDFQKTCTCDTSQTEYSESELILVGSQKTDQGAYPLCSAVKSNVPIYDSTTILESDREIMMAELHKCLLSGPGVFVVKSLVPQGDHPMIDRAEKALRTIIDAERKLSGAKGDHFAPAGANDRIWNSFQKFAQVDPEGFARYYANEAL